jgi:hypothetical protein
MPTDGYLSHEGLLHIGSANSASPAMAVGSIHLQLEHRMLLAAAAISTVNNFHAPSSTSANKDPAMSITTRRLRDPQRNELEPSQLRGLGLVSGEDSDSASQVYLDPTSQSNLEPVI